MNQIRQPPGWHDPDFKLQEIARFLQVPATTLDGWLSSARAQGHEAGVTRGRFRWHSAATVYAAALLAELANVGYPVTPDVIHSAFNFAGTTPHDGDVWIVSNSEAASIHVNASHCFRVVTHWAGRQRQVAA